MGGKKLFEVVLGTYEEYLLGYKYFSKVWEGIIHFNKISINTHIFIEQGIETHFCYS